MFSRAFFDSPASLCRLNLSHAHWIQADDVSAAAEEVRAYFAFIFNGKITSARLCRTGVSYEDALRDGVLLCKLMNKLQPGLVSKINTSGGDYKMMDNLNQFQKACMKYGVPDVDLFQAVDLMERKNIAQVTNTIFAIGRTTYKHPEWRGPWLGPKPAEENKRAFTEEQLRAGEGLIGLQAGTNKGATQAGQNFGATRKILLGK
ncbi:Muscle-specific protein 20 [Harpegnathos saltator]|uniref:Calponin n=1 Tax=Harpegnathos saltator TaxID=610380 RepID=E2BE60_HARSA|nr:Muscle-specific protein 20 [Harpegnathos saltator]